MVSTTSRANQSALPDAWIDRLFQRFSLMYGKEWAEKWSGLPLDQVKAAWSQDLAFASADQLRLALDHCKANNKFPPSSPEFVGLCKQFRVQGSPLLALVEPRGEMPAKVRDMLAKLRGAR